MPTFFCIGDCHFRLKRLAEGEAFVTWVVEKCRSMASLDAIVILGDLLHTFRVTHVEPFALMNSLVRGCAGVAATYVIIGNHDYPGPTEYQTSRHFMTPLIGTPNVTIVDRVMRITIGGKAYVMMPYLPYGRLREALAGVGKWRDAGLIFGHQPIRAVDPLAEPWSESYPTLVSGHIHDHQRPQPNVIYVGSISQVAINEHPDKYVWVLRDHAETLGVKKIRVPTRNVSLLHATPATLRTVFDPSILARHSAKIVLECSPEERAAFESSKTGVALAATSGVTISYRLSETRAEAEGASVVRPKSFDEILEALVAASEPRVIKAYSLISGNTKAEFIVVPS